MKNIHKIILGNVILCGSLNCGNHNSHNNSYKSMSQIKEKFSGEEYSILQTDFDKDGDEDILILRDKKDNSEFKFYFYENIGKDNYVSKRVITKK